MTGFPTVSCDNDENWIDQVEKDNEEQFMRLLKSCSSYEDFMIKTDINNASYNVEYFGFSNTNELFQFVKDYYASKIGYISYGDE